MVEQLRRGSDRVWYAILDYLPHVMAATIVAGVVFGFNLWSDCRDNTRSLANVITQQAQLHADVSARLTGVEERVTDLRVELAALKAPH